jgi:DNA (cytosine-5)-methyltransferase 1
LRRRLTARECARLQGFPEEFSFKAVGPKAAYKQAGNAVCVPVVRWVFEQHVKGLEDW